MELETVSKLSRRRLMVVVACLLIIGLSWGMVWRAQAGLVVRPFAHDGIPMRVIMPAAAHSAPGVIIAHGFSGSQQLMQGFAYTLAHAGYATLLFDFDGHAANPAPLAREGSLAANLDAAYAALAGREGIDHRRVALLGHSMGSGAVMAAGIKDADRYQATIAVSPTDAAVTAAVPRNLLLQAGQLEPQFAANATDLLARAGGAAVGFSDGRARSFQRVPGVEHITILFSPMAHRGVVSWLGQTFGPQPASDYTDMRMVWYLVQLTAWLVLVTAVTPLLRFPQTTAVPPRPTLWRLAGLLLVPLVATAVLALANQVIPLVELGGVLIAGALGLWFLLAGLVWLAGSVRPWPPAGRGILWGLAIFAFLWLAFGLMAQVVWLPWFLIPARLGRWPLLALAFFPWLLAAGQAQRGASTGQRVFCWFQQCVIAVGGLIAAVWLVPSLFFLVLVLPVLPIFLGIMAVVGGAVDDPWAYGLGNALFFAWLMMALFPLVS